MQVSWGHMFFLVLCQACMQPPSHLCWWPSDGHQSGLQDVKHMLSWNEVRWLTWTVKIISRRGHKKFTGCLVCVFTIIFLLQYSKIVGLLKKKSNNSTQNTPKIVKVTTLTVQSLSWSTAKPAERNEKPICNCTITLHNILLLSAAFLKRLLESGQQGLYYFLFCSPPVFFLSVFLLIRASFSLSAPFLTLATC